tara:strand:+ start:12217 stop:12657 length:441 start_codon:yes stop_codon:yes gene_type:complete
MKRIQAWSLFVIQVVVKLGLLGKYKLVSTSAIAPIVKPNQDGLKTLESTIISLGKKNDELKVTLNKTNLEVTDLEEKVIELSKDVVSSNQKLEFMASRNFQSEDKLSAMTIERGKLSKEIVELKTTVEQAETLSEQLKVEMKKWRT